jgi:MFS family permease
MRDLLSVLIKKISSSDEDVGFISGAQGLTMVILTVPIGLFGDKFLRQTLLRWSMVVAMIAMAITVYVFFQLQSNGSLILFYVGFGCWGVYVALANPALESLFADSVPTGNRTSIFSFKTACIQIASASGPLISVLLFYNLGNTFTLDVLRKVLLVGCVIGIIAVMFLACLRDDKGLGKESEVVEEEVMVVEEEEKDGDDEVRGVARSCTWMCGHKKFRSVRWTIAVSDIATSAAAGMTVKFFPLFFVSEATAGPKQGYAFTPINLSWMYLVMPLITTCVATLLPRIIKRGWCGRPSAVIVCKIFGIVALYTMVFFDVECSYPVSMACVFVFRTAIMNGSSGIRRSMMMDSVPKSQRVRWNSLESLTRMTWAGSAALGGWCVSSFGYRQTFLITAVVYTISTTPLLLLVPIME